MSSGTIITDYLGRGLLSAIPATPPIPTGGTAFYYATDVTTLYVWTGSAWVSTVNVAGSFGYPTWDAQNSRMDGFVLHPDRLTVTAPYNPGADRIMLATSSKSTGKWYFEALIRRISSIHFPITGVVTSTHSQTTFVGGDAAAGSGYGMGCAGNAWTGNTISGGLSTYAANDVLGVAVDFTAGTGSVTFYKNNVSNKVYGSLTPGTLFPATSCRSDGLGNSMSLRTLAAQCTYSPPAGFSNWT
jgi:hypothetical protein